MKNRWLGLAFVSLLAVACATSPTGRKQLMLVPDAQMDQMGAQAFQQLKAQTPSEGDPAINAYVLCVTRPLTDAVKGATDVKQWELVVFKDDTANAFALPGGKIGVHTGLLKVAKTDAQLAAVIGHEIGHVIARHGAERVSQQLGTQLALTGAGVLAPDSTEGRVILGALGVGAQFGILLPHSRTQESEADSIGLDLMSQAGFDPRQSVELWKNMAAASGGQSPPEWLSTHPANETRIEGLRSQMNTAMPKYQAAVSHGRQPKCDRARADLRAPAKDGAQAEVAFAAGALGLPAAGP
ncbi:MAG TPA: M48 family metallopeptidase [Bdellovibrionota bacterium]|nr:M48 family metallopeptidase [Bdellovibrionota bacterium]